MVFTRTILVTASSMSELKNLYTELSVISNFSFLEGGSHPEELVETAISLGYQTISLADKHTLSGVVRFHIAAKNLGIKGIIGSRIETEDGVDLICFPTNTSAYSRLTRLLSIGKRRTKKSRCKLWFKDIIEHALDQILIVLPPRFYSNPRLLEKNREVEAKFSRNLTEWRSLFPGSLYLGASVIYKGDDESRLNALFNLSKVTDVPMVALNDVLYHHPGRRPLQDVLTCIRKQCSINQVGFDLEANSERYLKSPVEMVRLFQNYPASIVNTAKIAQRCKFTLDELNYEYPDVLTQSGNTVEQELEIKTWQGANERYPFKDYPNGIPSVVKKQLKYELNLINKLKYARYFFTV